METLFVKSGIQYLDLPEPLDVTHPSAVDVYQFLGSDDIADNPTFRGVVTTDDVPDGPNDQGNPNEFTVQPIEALEMFVRRWFPVPYHSTHPYWVRAFLEPESVENQTVYRVVLACDTHSRSQGSDNDERGLLNREIGHTFRVDPSLEAFWEHEEIRRLTYPAWEAWIQQAGILDPNQPLAEALEQLDYRDGPGAAMARLRALAHYLEDKLPEIQILGGPMQQGAENVDAHLILDLGNCRTCGIIMETPPNGNPLFAGLEMRSRARPTSTSSGPFESYLQFVHEAEIGGDADTSRFSGVSLARLGDEALDATVHLNLGVVGAVTGMSSPKRYLWDDSLRPVSWSFTPTSNEGRCDPIEGALLRYIDMNDPFRAPQGGLLPNPAAPRYSRKSGLIFTLVEILEQAFSQMNSLAHRSKMPVQGGINRRRVFRNLVLVHPSGMTPLELEEFEKGVRRAVRIWYNSYRDPFAFRSGRPLAPPPPEQPEPQVHLDCDEATAVQLCYLYGEVQYRFPQDARRYFSVTGRRREEDGPPTLRLASLDVGGGTTDMVISEFWADPDAIGFTSIHSRPLFRDGLNMGGDDVAMEVLRNLVFPQMWEQLNIPGNVWKRLFSTTTGSMNRDLDALRRNLVNHVWVPIVRYFWSRAEAEVEQEQVTLRQALSGSRYPLTLLQDFNNYLAAQVRGQSPDISTVTLTFNVDAFNRVVNTVLGTALSNFSDIIAQFDCDLLLVAGRPAGLPELMRMLARYCPIPPARIESLQGHPVSSSWYPFARDGVIEDAKSSVVVGAAIHFVSSRVGEQFRLSQDHTPQVTSIIGIIERGMQEIPDHAVLFTLGNGGRHVSEPFQFGGDIWIGCRNIADGCALANPLFHLRWAPDVLDNLRDHRFRRLPVVPVVLRLEHQTRRRGKRALFRLAIHSVSGQFSNRTPVRPDKLQLSLQTMFTDDYWLDTGCFYHE